MPDQASWSCLLSGNSFPSADPVSETRPSRFWLLVLDGFGEPANFWSGVVWALCFGRLMHVVLVLWSISMQSGGSDLFDQQAITLPFEHLDWCARLNSQINCEGVILVLMRDIGFCLLSSYIKLGDRLSSAVRLWWINDVRHLFYVFLSIFLWMKSKLLLWLLDTIRWCKFGCRVVWDGDLSTFCNQWSWSM